MYHRYRRVGWGVVDSNNFRNIRSHLGSSQAPGHHLAGVGHHPGGVGHHGVDPLAPFRVVDGVGQAQPDV